MERDFHNVSTPSDRAPIVGCKGIKRVISSDLKGDNLIDAREKKDTGSMVLISFLVQKILLFLSVLCVRMIVFFFFFSFSEGISL